jgi:PII-like signaling protein
MKIPADAVLLRIFIGESDRHSEEKVNAFLPVLDGMMGGGLVTLERAKVIRYQDREKR